MRFIPFSFFIALIVLGAPLVFAQTADSRAPSPGDEKSSITGTWSGNLPETVGKLKVVLHVTSSESGLSAKMDSPDQNSFGIPVTSISHDANVTDKDNMTFKVDFLNASFSGRYSEKESEIQGTFTQNGASFPLNLKKSSE